MEMLSKEDVLNKYSLWSKALRIAFEINKPSTIDYISNKIGYNNRSAGYYNSLLKFLEYNDFIEIDRTGNIHIIKVHNKKLTNFLISGGDIANSYVCLSKLINPNGIWKIDF